MQKKSQDFSMEDAMRLANSPAGQQLLAMLQQADVQKVQQAANQAAQGDYTSAAQIARQLMSDPEVQALMRQLGG